jgi:hypothetical protein
MLFQVKHKGHAVSMRTAQRTVSVLINLNLMIFIANVYPKVCFHHTIIKSIKGLNGFRTLSTDTDNHKSSLAVRFMQMTTLGLVNRQLMEAFFAAGHCGC